MSEAVQCSERIVKPAMQHANGCSLAQLSGLHIGRASPEMRCPVFCARHTQVQGLVGDGPSKLCLPSLSFTYCSEKLVKVANWKSRPSRLSIPFLPVADLEDGSDVPSKGAHLPCAAKHGLGSLEAHRIGVVKQAATRAPIVLRPATPPQLPQFPHGGACTTSWCSRF